MRKLVLMSAVTLALANSGIATAQDYPTRPIKVVVPFPAGGPTDALVRVLGERMRSSLGQPLVVENVIGGAGSIGVRRVVRAAPDGYTVSIGHWSTHVLNGAVYRLDYDLLKDLDPVVLLPSNAMIVVARSGLPATSLKELIEWLRAHPDKASAGTAGLGSGTHLAGVYLQNLTDTRFQFVPYRGTGPAILDMEGERIDIMVDQASNSLPHVSGGRVKAFAVTASNRLASAPDIPTVDEAGLPGFHVSIWYGLWVPKGTPRPIIDKLNAAAVQALADPEVRQRLEALGLEMPPAGKQSPEALGLHQKSEIDKWWPIVRAANIKVE